MQYPHGPLCNSAHRESHRVSPQWNSLNVYRGEEFTAPVAGKTSSLLIDMHYARPSSVRRTRNASVSYKQATPRIYNVNAAGCFLFFFATLFQQLHTTGNNRPIMMMRLSSIFSKILFLSYNLVPYFLCLTTVSYTHLSKNLII